MEANLYNQTGEVVGLIQVSDTVFGIEPNVGVMHQAMVRQMANARTGTHNTRRRGEVRGSTRKLYRQKGTGRARQGSIRAPHRRGGGVAHGPHPRSYEKKMPRKMRRLAVRSALSSKFEHIRFVETLELDEPRTRDMITILDELELDGNVLVVLEATNENIQLSAKNLPYVKTLLANYLNVVDLLRFDYIIMTRTAAQVAQGYLGGGDVTLLAAPSDARNNQTEVPVAASTEPDEADEADETDETEEA